MKDGGPAFPIHGYTADASGALNGETVQSPGMSIRDWFAGQAIPVIVAAALNGRRFGYVHFPDGTIKPMSHAWHAYNIADAMLAERAKGGAA